MVVPAPLREVGLAGEDGPVSNTPTTAPPGRLLLTGYAVAQLFLSFVMIVLFVLWVVGGVLVVVWVGIGILVAVVPATRWVANLHRSMAERTLGSSISWTFRCCQKAGCYERLRRTVLPLSSDRFPHRRCRSR